MKVNKKRIFVISFLALYALYLFIAIRIEYLQILNIGERFVPVFWQNMRYRITVTSINFVFIFLVVFVTTIFIKKGLKKFFDDEKKEMPKLPHKSLSLVIGIIGSMITSNMITERAILAFNTSVFGMRDPVFNLDISYFIFQKPFIELLLYYFIGIMVVLSLYVIIYHIVVFNKFFNQGIDRELLKKSIAVRHLVWNIILISVGVAGITLLNSQGIVLGRFLTLSDGTALTRSRVFRCNNKVMGI